MLKYNGILEKLDEDLDALESKTNDILHSAEQGIKISKRALKNIRALIVDSEFDSAQEEIQFFKEVKPKIYSKLIYFVRLFSIESKRPRGSNKNQIKYLNNHIDKLQVYFNDNLEFYHYYRRNATSLDEQYFLRGKTDIRLFPDTFHCFTDEKFSASHDNTVATIIAYDMLIVHLKTQIDKLENNNGMETTNSYLLKPSNLFSRNKKSRFNQS
ncbi:RteC domain-containing protein [Aquimarina aggregata]|uniref:RteC domain-containing protein n=1 Tax=Aquimarina aggregata TaxID=1642818 RepID=UPI0031EAE8CB